MKENVLEVHQIKKSFGDTVVLRGVDLQAAEGEFVTILGASGCGKTTTLRIIAGFEEADSGQVYLGGVDVTEFEPNHRNVNTVFQNYALFPHMNVEKNVGYGLRMCGIPKDEIKERVNQTLKQVQMEEYGKRRPSELSGGQCQRVAIARAIINQPKVLLLDEPLGALDLKLRKQLQVELKSLQSQLGTTFVYITHDQEEAAYLSDQIVVMRDGMIEQAGTTEDIFKRPATDYVKEFIAN